VAGAYQAGIALLINGGVDLDTDTVKFMLLSESYTYNPDHNDVADLTAGGGELSCTGYTGGFNGSGRKTATVTIVVNNTNNRVDVGFNDLTWSALGGASNDECQGCALIFEVTDDAGSTPIVFLNWSGGNFTTNGSDVTVDFTAAASGGNFRFAC
jgi:hypothetical protein